jgi:hypothetical protein
MNVGAPATRAARSCSRCSRETAHELPGRVLACEEWRESSFGLSAVLASPYMSAMNAV